ncbi:MAG: hypothetical protein HYT64_00330 [Candidatus Yanofskybacteria bacterium]|nr:hypothetical protein [Candidatus Yanofskybacteria bacterium]
MFLISAVLFALQVVSGSGADPPDIKNFIPIISEVSEELDFKIDDYKTAFVGRIVIYQNLDDPNEFVLVYYRQVAVISKRAQEKNSSEYDGRGANLSNFKYHSQQETEVLDRVQKATDAFAYIQWREIKDSRSGKNIRTGFMHIWLLDSSGVWRYHIQPVNEKSALEPSPFSEPSKADPKERINVGIQFKLGAAVHIVRVDQDDIFMAEPFDDTQAEEADNEKK